MASAEGGSFFFHPVEFDLQTSDLFEQSGCPGLTGGGLATVTWLWRETSAALGTTKSALRAEKEQRELAEASSAAKTIALARAAVHFNRVDEARRLLAECPEAHRDREWRYLER